MVWKPVAFSNAAPIYLGQFPLPHINPWLSARGGSHSLACPGRGTSLLCGALLLRSACAQNYFYVPCMKMPWEMGFIMLSFQKDEGVFPCCVSCQSSRAVRVGGGLSGEKVSGLSENGASPFLLHTLSPLVGTRLPWNVLWFLFPGKVGVMYCSGKSSK